jgi:uncharacterized protein with HXXEE motif
VNVERILQRVNALSFDQAVWLFPRAFAVHVLEEAPQFTNWVNRYASRRFTPRDFVWNNSMGMAAALLACTRISVAPNRAIVFVAFATVFTQTLVFNALFHVGTTAAYGTYSPGLITSLTIYPLLYYYLSRLAYHEGLLTDASGLMALGIAGMIHGYVVAVQVYSFKWPGTRDWRVREDGSAEAARRGVDG